MLNDMSPQKALNLTQALLDIASVLKNLSADPKNLENLAKAAHALPDAEMLRAKEARESIAKHQAAAADAEATMKQMDEYQKQLDAREKASKEEAERLVALEKSITARMKDQERQTADLIQRESDLAQKIADSAEEAGRLEQLKITLQKQQEEVADYEKSVKAKAAAAMKALA